MTCSNEKTISKIKGNTYSRTLIFKDSAGTLINLTGSTVVFSVKNSVSDVTYVLQETLLIPTPANGEAILSTPLSMAEGAYVYDFQWTDSLDQVITLEIGKLVITNGAT